MGSTFVRMPLAATFAASLLLGGMGESLAMEEWQIGHGGYVTASDVRNHNKMPLDIRDVNDALAAAIRTSLGIALLTTALAGVVGVGLGFLAGVRGGIVDRLLSTFADMLLALPGLLLVLLLVALAPGQFWPLYLGISLVLWIEYFRMSRAAAIRVASSPAVEASRLLGFGPIYLFRRHFWPEMMATILVVGAFGAGTAIMSVAALGFISVGVRPPTPELGQMMIELLPYYHEAPWAIAQPVLVVFLAVLALNLIAGGRTR